MKEKLKTLIKLQACDNRIDQILEKKREMPEQIRSLKEKSSTALSRFEEDALRLEGLIKERRQIEKEVEEFDSKIRKSNEKLSNIKSNKEYTAALKEIKDIQSAKSKAEDKLIQLLEEIETQGERGKTNEEEKRTLEKELELCERAIQEELSVLEGELLTLEGKCKSLRQDADKVLLKRYILLKERKGGRAISPVIEGVCQTCHLGIPPQKFRELLKCDELMTCPHCHRMIFWGEDEHFQNIQKEV